MTKILKKTMTIILGCIATIYLICGILLYVKQRDFLYFPQPYKQNAYPSIDLQVDGENINVILLEDNEANEAKTSKPAVIYFGGNAEAVINSTNIFKPLLSDHDVYLVNYRGYGSSTGSITEENVYADALAVYEYVKQTHTDISLVGRSLGTGVATYVAANKPVTKLVLITPYDSIVDVAQSKFAIYPINLLLKDKYLSVLRAPNIQADTLILSAENDTLIPVAHSKKLANAFLQPVDYQQIPMANHNDIMMKQTALRHFWQFFQ